MEISAKAKYIHQSPRKVRLVANLIRGLDADAALAQLRHANKRAAGPIMKLLHSAVASGEHNHELSRGNLRVKEIRVDEGPTLHRWQPRAQGRATPIRKRTSHLTLVLAEIVASGQAEKKKQEIAAPLKLDHRPKEEEGVLIKSETAGQSKERKSFDGADKGQKIIDPREEGKGKHAKIEGGSHRGFVGKIFRRKSG